MDNYKLEEQAEKFISNRDRLLDFIWFTNHTSFGENEINYLIDKFDISKELIDYIKDTIRKTPTWVIRLANGMNNNYYDGDLGFKEYIDKKEGFHKICANCIYYNPKYEYCDKGEHSTQPGFWRFCATK